MDVKRQLCDLYSTDCTNCFTHMHIDVPYNNPIRWGCIIISTAETVPSNEVEI